MAKKKITFAILLLLIFSDVLETITQFCFKKSALFSINPRLSSLNSIIIFLKGAFSSPFLWFGLLSVLVTFVIWTSILSKIDLSVAVPVASFSYIFVPLVSIFFLHENISLLRWCGIASILLGVIFVSLSSNQKESKANE